MNKPLLSCLICALLTGLLNSCYFNSTGRLLDRVEYEARATTADLETQPVPLVYTDSSEYYIELPRYRNGATPQLHYTLFNMQDCPADAAEKRGMGMFRIPQDYADWLTGKGRKVTTVTFLEEMPDAATIKARCTTIPIVKKAGERVVNYTYRSPNAAWMNVAVPFNWLFVDLPVTIAENAAIAACAVGIVFLMLEDDDDECPHCGHCLH